MNTTAILAIAALLVGLALGGIAIMKINAGQIETLSAGKTQALAERDSAIAISDQTAEAALASIGRSEGTAQILADLNRQVDERRAQEAAIAARINRAAATDDGPVAPVVRDTIDSLYAEAP